MSEPDAKGSLVPAGCESCPNRQQQRDRGLGKVAAYGFASVLTLLFVAFSVERKDSSWQAKENPPYGVWLVLTPIITACLGVQIDPEPLGKAVRSFLKVDDGKA